MRAQAHRHCRYYNIGTNKLYSVLLEFSMSREENVNNRNAMTLAMHAEKRERLESYTPAQ
jgi:hypothetical protein